MKKTTLCLVLDSKNQVLLIQKKRGLGQGKWNFPGGKVDQNESIETAARREVLEETGVRVGAIKKIGILEFIFQGAAAKHNNECHVFMSQEFDGHGVQKSDECDSFWWSKEDLDWNKFWPDDKIWVPLALKNQYFYRQYLFDENDNLLEEKILDTRQV